MDWSSCVRFERIKGVHLTLTPFADDILTPTLKVKRYVGFSRAAVQLL